MIIFAFDPLSNLTPSGARDVQSPYESASYTFMYLIIKKYKIRERKVKILPKIEEITVGQVHGNLIKIFRRTQLSFSIRRERMYVNTQQRCVTIIRPTGLSARGSGFLLLKNGIDQPRLNSTVQLGGPLPRVENGNKY